MFENWLFDLVLAQVHGAPRESDAVESIRRD